MNQKEALLKYLKTHRAGITTWVAFDLLGISSLHSRIRDLEAQGIAIHRQPIMGTNRYGNPCRVTKYRLGVWGNDG